MLRQQDDSPTDGFGIRGQGEVIDDFWALPWALLGLCVAVLRAAGWACGRGQEPRTDAGGVLANQLPTQETSEIRERIHRVTNHVQDTRRVVLDAGCIGAQWRVGKGLIGSGGVKSTIMDCIIRAAYRIRLVV